MVFTIFRLNEIHTCISNKFLQCLKPPFFLFWIQILRSKNKIYSYWHTTVRQNNMIWEGICVVFFTWNILLLSYINKIEAVTLKHIKKKNSTRVLLAPVQKTPQKNKNKKKHTKKSIESQKVLILMIYLLILWILIFVSFFQNNFSTSS